MAKRQTRPLTRERLHEVLDYDPATGVFRWRVRTGPRAKPGEIAGSVSRGSKGYCHISVDGVLHNAARLAWLSVYGEPIPAQLDHINRLRDDNRIANLRPADEFLSAINRGMRSDNTSGFRGVSWVRKLGKWKVQFSIRGQRTILGYFDDPAEAGDVHRAATLAAFGEYAPEE